MRVTPRLEAVMMKLYCMRCLGEDDLGFEVEFDGEDLEEVICVCAACTSPRADDAPRVTRRYFPVRDA